MPSPIVQHEHNPYTLPRLHSLASVGLAAIAFAAGTSSTSEAEAYQVASPEVQTAQLLEKRIAHGQPVTYDANHELLWSKSKVSRDYAHLTDVPLKARVGGQDRNFMLRLRDKTLSSADVTALPKEVTEVQSALTSTSLPGEPWTSTKITSSRGVVALNKQGEAVVDVHYATGQHKAVQIGKTTVAPEQSDATTGGKRFASTAPERKLSHAKTIEQVQAAMQSFLREYGVVANIVFVDPSLSATFETVQPADLGALRKYGSMLIDEWAKYPLDWVKHSQLRQIAIVRNLMVDGTRRAAVPDPSTQTMYYDPSYGTGEYARGVVHHDYDHFVTYNTYHSYIVPGSTWASMNPPGFKYGQGGAACYQSTTYCLSGEHPLPGFVSGYATSAIEEDRAEVASHLMTKSYYHRLKRWIKTDSYLAKKVQYYKRFAKGISSKMSGNYWDIINP